MKRLILILWLLFVSVAPAYAQGGESSSDGLPLPAPLLLLGVVILALLLRSWGGGGHDEAIDDEIFDKDEIPNRKKSRRRGKNWRDPNDEDQERFLMEREDLWEDDGYVGEDDEVDF